MSRLAWKAFAGVSAAVAAAGARKALRSGWKRVRNEEPPQNPASSSVGWGNALAWGLLIGVTAGVARIASRRIAAHLWKTGLDENPPA